MIWRLRAWCALKLWRSLLLRPSRCGAGDLALPVRDPEFFPATVMNYNPGGFCNGILNLILREEKGYTYGAHSRFSGDELAGTLSPDSVQKKSLNRDPVEGFWYP